MSVAFANWVAVADRGSLMASNARSTSAVFSLPKSAADRRRASVCGSLK
jgi:chemotaxis response regulator CheB